MKKILLMTIAFFGIVLCNKVSALDFVEEWKTQDVSITEENLIYNNYTSYLEGYLNSYVITNDGNYTSVLTYYDKKGNVLLTKNNISFRIDDLITDGENIYALYYNSTLELGNTYGIVLFNKNLEIQKEVILTDYNRNEEIYRRKLLGDSFISIENNNIIIDSGSIIFVVDKELTKDSYESSNQFHTSDYNNYNMINGRYSTYKDGRAEYKSVKLKNDKIVASGSYYTNNCSDENDMHCSIALVSVFDKDYNKIWTKDYGDYLSITNAHYIGRYIIGIATKYSGHGSSEYYVIIMDQEGNIIKELKKDSKILMLKDINNGFMVTNYSTQNNTFNTDLYRIMNTISIKKTGSGRVEVSGSGLAGSVVDFKILPDNGFTLSNIKVTDVEGNKIEINNNTFVMPESDVLIEAVFVSAVINPETADLTVIVLFIVASVALFLTIYFVKEKKWLD